MNQAESTQVQQTIISSTNTTTINCTSCQNQLDGNFARALDGAFHWECFLCIVSMNKNKGEGRLQRHVELFFYCYY